MKSGKITGAYIKTKSLEEILPPAPPEKIPQQDDKKIAKEAKARRKALEKQLSALLRANFPNLFNEENPKPLAVGIHHEIAALYPQFSGVIIRKLLKRWVRAPRYLNAILKGPDRHNLNGDAVAPISESERTFAADLIEAMLNKAQ